MFKKTLTFENRSEMDNFIAFLESTHKTDYFTHIWEIKKKVLKQLSAPSSDKSDCEMCGKKSITDNHFEVCKKCVDGWTKCR